MKTAARRLPALPIALAASLLAGFLILLSPLSASAHDGLIASSPEADTSVETLPTELTLTFSAELITGEGATEVVVTDASGTSVTDGAATVEGAVVTQPLVSEAAAGEYHVIWKVVSSDGHPTADEFFFTVTTATTSVPATPDETTAPTTAPPTTTAEPQDTAAPQESDTPAAGVDDSATSAPAVWIVSIIGALVVIALIVWLTLRARKKAAGADSDPSTER